MYKKVHQFHSPGEATFKFDIYLSKFSPYLYAPLQLALSLFFLVYSEYGSMSTSFFLVVMYHHLNQSWINRLLGYLSFSLSEARFRKVYMLFVLLLQ